jgi:hypothetical protein
LTFDFFLFFLLKRRHFDLKKNWPGRPGQNQEPGPWTGPATVANPLTFYYYFFTKTMSFWFKKRTDPADPVTRLQPGIRALDRTGS